MKKMLQRGAEGGLGGWGGQSRDAIQSRRSGYVRGARAGVAVNQTACRFEEEWRTVAALKMALVRRFHPKALYAGTHTSTRPKHANHAKKASERVRVRKRAHVSPHTVTVIVRRGVVVLRCAIESGEVAAAGFLREKGSSVRCPMGARKNNGILHVKLQFSLS